MNILEFVRKRSFARQLGCLIVLLALLLPGGAKATDCDTDCDNACLTSWRVPCGIGCWRDVEVVDKACKLRCDAEKTLACETGLNFCDLQRIANPDEWWQVKTAMQSATDTQVIHDRNHCEEIVSGTGGAVSTADFLLDLGLPPGVVSLAQHFLGCICNELDYGNSPSDEASTGPGGEDAPTPGASDAPEGGIATGVVKDKKKEAVLMILNQYMLKGF